MGFTPFQAEILRLLSSVRDEGGAYLAGSGALGLSVGAPRVSKDLDLFHDVREAVLASYAADVRLLREHGMTVVEERAIEGFARAVVARGADATRLEWAHDSAFRFFPLVRSDGILHLHPVDAATNKTLALVGRLEAKDWVDLLECDRRVQPLGYLAWAACGKDPGFTPDGILEIASRTGRYAKAELDALDAALDAAALGAAWRGALDRAREVVAALPMDRAGRLVVDSSGAPYRGSPEDLRRDLAAGTVGFHDGRIGGAMPRLARQGPPTAPTRTSGEGP